MAIHHVPSDNVFSVPEFNFADFNGSGIVYYYDSSPVYVSSGWSSNVKIAFIKYRTQYVYMIVSSINTEPTVYFSGGSVFTLSISTSFEYDNKTVYYNSYNLGSASAITSDYPITQWTVDPNSNNRIRNVGWLMSQGGYDSNIIYNLTNCTGSSANPIRFDSVEDFEVIFTADEGYSFVGTHDEVVITGATMAATPTPVLEGGTISFYVRPIEGATLITITVTAGQKIRVQYILNACHLGPQSVATNPEFVERGELYDFNFIADTGYRFNSRQDIATNDGIVLFDPRNRLPDTYCLIYGRVSADAETVVISVNLAGDPYEDLDGEEDPESETVTPPGVPTTTAVSAGIIGIFVPTINQMRDLADFMWTNFGGTATTTDEILEEIVEAFKRSISNPLDYIFGLNIIPSNGLSIGTSKTVRFGFFSSNVSMPTLANQFFDVDCGSVSFGYECGGTFLDFAPYSKISLYLPYIGFRDVDANDFIGHTISIRYRCDAVSGACVAYISKDGSVMYQYSGNCACTIPLGSDSWVNSIGTVIQSGTTIGAGAAIGGVTGGGAGAAAGAGIGAINGAASVAGNPSLLAPKVNRVGSLAGSAGLLGIQYPFVVREAPRFHSTNGFNAIAGYPSWYYMSLGSLVGFTKVVNVHLHNINALRDELDEIETLLKGGVIL